jgi:hypothetical protein
MVIWRLIQLYVVTVTVVNITNLELQHVTVRTSFPILYTSRNFLSELTMPFPGALRRIVISIRTFEAPPLSATGGATAAGFEFPQLGVVAHLTSTSGESTRPDLEGEEELLEEESPLEPLSFRSLSRLGALLGVSWYGLADDNNDDDDDDDDNNNDDDDGGGGGGGCVGVGVGVIAHLPVTVS